MSKNDDTESMVLICGDRNWDNVKVIREFVSLLNKDFVILEGGAPGADTIAREVAKESNRKFIEVKANWGELGKAAGPIRNREMLKMHPKLVVGFHDDIFESKGTANMISISRMNDTPYMVINSKGIIYQYGNLKETWIEKLSTSKFQFKGD